MTLKGIIFDLDGTIVNSEYVQFLTFNEYFKINHGKTIEWEYWKQYCFGKTATGIMKHLSLYFSVFIDNGEALVKGLHYYIKLIEEGHLKAIDGFHDFLEWLNSIELSSIIASNSEPVLIEITLKSVELWDKMDFLSIRDTNNPKPDPQIYLLAAKRMNLSPEECVIIEDYPSCIKTAKDIGSLVIAVNSGFNDDYFAGADLIIENYLDPRLKKLIQARI
ncbi:MAG: HAD family hydrolase [Candidatus Hodarchaeales archaeon]|jgi:HAD superfamily hydrolase (TIGR01509 family)